MPEAIMPEAIAFNTVGNAALFRCSLLLDWLSSKAAVVVEPLDRSSVCDVPWNPYSPTSPSQLPRHLHGSGVAVNGACTWAAR